MVGAAAGAEEHLPRLLPPSASGKPTLSRSLDSWSPPAYWNWKSALRQEVAAASGRPEVAFKWFQATDELIFERLTSLGKSPYT